MQPRVRFWRALHGLPVDRPPVAAVNTTATASQMEAVQAWFPEAYREAGPMARLAAAAYEQFGLETVGLPFDQCVEAEVWGCEVRYGGRFDPLSVVSHPYTLDQPPPFPPDFLSRGRIPAVLEALRRLRSQVGAQVTVIGRVIGPFTTAGYWIGTDELLVQSVLAAEKVSRLMEVARQGAAMLAEAMVAAGADIICVEDMTASGDMISPETYRNLVLPHHQWLFANIPVPGILHICGHVDRQIEAMAESGAAGLSIDAVTNLATARLKVAGKGPKDHVTLIGNVPPTAVLLQGTPERIRQAVQQALGEGIGILAPGCGIPVQTPASNLRTFVEAGRELGIMAARDRLAASASMPRALPNAVSAGTAAAGHLSATVTVFRRYDVELARERGESVRTFAHSPLAVPQDESRALLARVVEAVVAGSAEEVSRAVERALSILPPLEVIEKGLVAGMNETGRLWSDGEYFLPQVILAADALQAGMRRCEKAMGAQRQAKGLVVSHVAEGDIHTIGKNIVKSLLEAYGYRVIDLGIDVPTDKVVAAVRHYRPQLLVGHALMTTTMSAFPRTAAALQAEGLELPFACGGGAVTQEFCESFPLGVYGEKAIEAPAIAQAAAEGATWQELRRRFHKK